MPLNFQTATLEEFAQAEGETEGIRRCRELARKLLTMPGARHAPCPHGKDVLFDICWRGCDD